VDVWSRWRKENPEEKLDLGEVYLFGADLSSIRGGWITFGNVDLSNVKGLDTAIYKGPSTIGIDAPYRSKGNISLTNWEYKQNER